MVEDSITMEAILTTILKFGWLVLGALVGHQFYERRADKVRLNDTYTKSETDNQIDLKLEPVRVDIAHLSDTIVRQTEALDKNTSALIALSTSQQYIQKQIDKHEDKER